MDYVKSPVVSWFQNCSFQPMPLHTCMVFRSVLNAMLKTYIKLPVYTLRLESHAMCVLGCADLSEIRLLGKWWTPIPRRLSGWTNAWWRLPPALEVVVINHWGPLGVRWVIRRRIFRGDPRGSPQAITMCDHSILASHNGENFNSCVSLLFSSC